MDLLPPLLVALPLLAAALLGSAPHRWPRAFADVLALAVAACDALAALWLSHAHSRPQVYWFGGWRPSAGIALGIAFVTDGFGAALVATVNALGVAALTYAWRYFDSVGVSFHVLLLVFLGAMNGFCLSGDLFTTFVFFELMSVAAYALAGQKIEAQSLEGAFNFAVTNSLGAFCFLWGTALLYAKFGALNLAQLGVALSAAGPSAKVLVAVAFALVATGFLVKAAAVPFHFWLPDAHAVAPTPVCALFSGVMVELGIYGLARTHTVVFAPAFGTTDAAVRAILVGVGAVSAVVGAAMCYRQRHLKRLLAFSTVSHAGLMTVGVFLGPVGALAGAALYLVSHALVKGALFFCSGMLLNGLGSVDAIALRGRGRALPSVGVLWGVGGLALAAMPPFGTGVAEGMVERAGHDAGHGWLPWVSLFASVLTGAAVLRTGGGIFLGWGPRPEDEEDQGAPTCAEGAENQEKPSGKLPFAMIGTTAVLLTVAAFIAWPPGVRSGAQAGARTFSDGEGYRTAVLGDAGTSGAATASPTASSPSSPLAVNVVPGLVSGVLAIACAAGSLAIDRFPEGLRRFGKRTLEPVLSFLERLHSGNVTDYALALLLGAALVVSLCIAVTWAR